MKKDSGLISRILTGAVVSAVIVLCVVYSKYEWVLSALVTVLTFFGAGEILSAARISKKEPIYWIATLIFTAAAYLKVPYYTTILFVALFGAIILFFSLIPNIKDSVCLPYSLTVVIAAIVTIFFKSIVYIREVTNAYILAMAFLVPAVTDIMAYFVGRFIGKHKLAPVISPKKTIEGSIGGSVFAVGILMLVSYILQNNGVISVNYIELAIYLLIASVLGQFGDLAFSIVKRIAKIKDFGKILPGHGGILDRFDSALFVMPFTLFYYLVI